MSDNGHDNTTVKARMVDLTPAIAEKLLQKNTHNRPVLASRVAQYAVDMRNGDWQFNGEAIKTSIDGQILDGQHRLLAVIEANTPVKVLLITGLPADTQETMDQGRARSFGDVLKLRGEHNYNVIAAAVRMICLYETTGAPFHAGRMHAPSVKELSRCLHLNPEIRDSAQLASGWYRPWLGASIVAALHYLFATASREDADDFFTRLATGENLARHDAIYVLRERLIKEHYDGGLNVRVRLAFIVRSWNAYRQGEVISRLVWNPGGSSPDRFPEVDGLLSHAPVAA